MVVYAKSGVGKTSVLAKVYDLIPEWFSKVRIPQVYGVVHVVSLASLLIFFVCCPFSREHVGNSTPPNRAK